MRQLAPTYAADVDLVTAYAHPPGLARPWVRANMVSSADGSAVLNGRAEGLSSPPDQHVFRLLRGLADAVLVGAGTARIEGYRALEAKPEYAVLRASLGQRPAPVLVVVSRRLVLDPDSKLFHGGAQRTVVVTVSDADPGRRAALESVADVIIAGEQSVDVSAALASLAERGLLRVLCEGGPHLLAGVTAAGHLDELCLTISPQLVGGDARRILAGAPVDVPLALGHLLEEDGVLLARYVRARGQPSPAP
jgi:riboflavin biosynthesis pyrimidine reductase